jgi:hypothetical protein
MIVGHNGSSIIDSENFLLETACQPRAVIRVGIKKRKKRTLITWPLTFGDEEVLQKGG